MAQKSIMSFFKRVKAKDDENIKTNDENKDAAGASTSNPVDSNSKAETVADDKGNITEDSPVKNSAVKRKRVQAIESDNEQEEPVLCNNRDLTKAEKDSLIIKPDEKKVCLISNIVVDGIPLRRCAGTPADSIALTKRMIEREKENDAEEGTVKKVDTSDVMKEEIKLEEDKLNTNIVDNQKPEAIVNIKKREILPDDDTVMISPGKQCNKSDDSGLEDSPVKPTRKSIKGRKSKILSDDSEDSNDSPPNKKSKSPEKSKSMKSSKTKSPVKSESSKKSPTADKNKTDSGTVRKSLQNFFAPRKPVENTESEVKEANKENKKVSPVKNKNNDDKKGKVAEESNDEDKKATDNNVKEKVAADDAKKKNSTARADDPITGSDYNPAKSKYHPIDDAIWKRDEKVPFIALARTMECIESTRSRLKIVEILSNYFRSVIALTPQDLLPSIYLCLNKLAPDYYNIELGIAEFSLMKAIAQCTGRSVAQIKADTASTGDLGIVAEQSKSNQRMMFKPNPLTVRFLFEKLKDVGQMSGQASMSKKLDKIQSLFVACRGSESRFLIRSLLGKLRIGLAEQSVLQALSVACVNTPPGQDYPPEKLDVASSMSQESFKSRVDDEALIIKSTYCECPNYDMIIPVLLEKGVKELPNHCRITPGIPIKPMLAHPTKGVHEVLLRLDGLKFTCEWKYDGERAQIHRSDDGKISIYSRNQENNTSKYPDIVSRLPSCFGPNVKSCIIDSEAVAWDVKSKKIRPFQILSTRKRKDANESEIKVQVIVFLFDLLYLNGKSLVKETLTERRRLLKENFIEVEEQFVFAKSLDTTTMEEVQDFLDDSVKGNCEGLMVKTLEEEATYEIAKRSRNWLKLKKDYLDGVGDTLDLVVIGGYLGRGKRTGCYGGFLLACYDPSSEEYQSICKIGTGFSDEDLQKHSEYLKQHIIQQERPYYRFDPSHEPDHWFEPTQVWEIKCADLSLSPAHRAAIGIVDPEKGISLRFPRFLRIRDDKSVEDATSARQVADMYLNQDQIKNQAGDGNRAPEEDFY